MEHDFPLHFSEMTPYFYTPNYLDPRSYVDFSSVSLNDIFRDNFERLRLLDQRLADSTGQWKGPTTNTGWAKTLDIDEAYNYSSQDIETITSATTHFVSLVQAAVSHAGIAPSGADFVDRTLAKDFGPPSLVTALLDVAKYQAQLWLHQSIVKLFSSLDGIADELREHLPPPVVDFVSYSPTPVGD
jgi:hypothetical protein